MSVIVLLFLAVIAIFFVAGLPSEAPRYIRTSLLTANAGLIHSHIVPKCYQNV